MDFTPENVFSLIQSGEEFPIDFDDAWQWVGYATKRNAKDSLTSSFIEDIDFLRKGTKSPAGGRPSEWIVLTIDCFKSFAMMAGTERGRQVRQYFLHCETELKRRLQAEQDRKKQRVLRAVVDSQPSTWRKRFEDEFFEEAYRITGWQRVSSGHPLCMGKFINQNVYDLFPEGTTQRLDQVNPVKNGASRSRKHHQHLTPDIGLPLLDYQKGITIAVMRLSPSNNSKRFKANMNKACGGSVQIELPFIDDMNQLDEAS